MVRSSKASCLLSLNTQCLAKCLAHCNKAFKRFSMNIGNSVSGTRTLPLGQLPMTVMFIFLCPSGSSGNILQAKGPCAYCLGWKQSAGNTATYSLHIPEITKESEQVEEE